MAQCCRVRTNEGRVATLASSRESGPSYPSGQHGTHSAQILCSYGGSGLEDRFLCMVCTKNGTEVSITDVPLPIRAWMCVDEYVFDCACVCVCGGGIKEVMQEVGSWRSSSQLVCLTYTCVRRRRAHTPDSWRSSTSGRCSDTSLCVSQSGCCGRVRSTAGRSPQCRATTRCRRDRASQRSPSLGWARRNWASPRSTPGRAQWGAWRRRTWLAGSPPSHETRGASPPPSLRRCRTCPSGSRPACGSPAAPTSTSSPRSFQKGRDICSAGACDPG